MESHNSEPASFVPQSRIPLRRQSSSTSMHYHYSPPSPTRPGLNASIHAPFRQRRGLNASIHSSSSSSSSEDLCDSIYTPGFPPRPVSSASMHASRSPPPRQDLTACIHAPRTPPKKGLNASIHAPSQHELVEPTMPIPVVDISPERRVRRVIDPQRECDIIVLVGGGSVSSVPP